MCGVNVLGPLSAGRPYGTYYAAYGAGGEGGSSR